MIVRRASRPIDIGTVTVGGNAPVSVQSMTKTDTRDVSATTAQIAELTDAGCEIVRVAVPDNEAAEALA
ncbi:MAG: flavodoxin-dependent (E)-4-hydroxy-3-methylbut-2-enyl-diphosphate synthase, partial [Dehalococcoidia bacterium]